ncbi:MAG: MmgE/PrpD family protein [Gammaproteobacteria bacterium]|nr:MmgE/PrpD family protein [Gammaproteobacteria bacterium]
MDKQTALQEVRTDGLTHRLSEYTSSLRYETLPEDVRAIARHCILDWFGVTLAGSREDTARIVLAEALEQGGAAQATLVGDGTRTGVLQAALVNGTASHALDYDDVQFAMFGHPTVTVVPAVLALAERDGLSGRELLTAFVAGVEAECRIGLLATDGHYARGYHATGTFGTFGAAASAARMLGLDADTTAIALGIAGTQAAGLKAVFGTMCKPLHAGKAAANGLYGALLAKRGFTSRDDILECDQGFVSTLSPGMDAEAALRGLGEQFHTRDVLFKYHAACYGTHASINAARRLREQHDIDPEQVAKIEIKVPVRNLKVCNIQNPQTGLEAKFSLRLTAAMALTGVNTADIAVYTDELCRAPTLIALRDKARIVGEQSFARGQTEVIVSMRDGVVYREFGDVSVPDSDLDHQGARLEEKFRAIATPIIGEKKADELIALVAEIDSLDDMSPLLARAH